jgi:transcriptional regulator with XRE-family HTH domain
MMDVPGLREVRERRLLTQRELAVLTGLSRMAISELENGRTAARISTVRRLAAALEVEPHLLTRLPELERTAARAA